VQWMAHVILSSPLTTSQSRAENCARHQGPQRRGGGADTR
jgi:hypothetical protein